MKYNTLFDINKVATEKFLSESLVSGEFTFGFELEAIAPTSEKFAEWIKKRVKDHLPKAKEVESTTMEDVDDDEYDFRTYTNLYKQSLEFIKYLEEWKDVPSQDDFEDKYESVSRFVIGELDEEFADFLSDEHKVLKTVRDIIQLYIEDPNIDLKEDESIESKNNWDMPFEYASVPMSFTPLNLKKMANCLIELQKHIYVNDTCGFHIHFSFPTITSNDTIWILCNLAMDEKSKYFLEYGITDYIFNNKYFANTQFLTELEDAITNKHFDDIMDILPKEKHYSFKIHEQGTLEWRGPRMFVNDANEIIKFTKAIYTVVNLFIEYMNKKYIVIDSTPMTRDNFFKHITKADSYGDELVFNSDYETKETKLRKKLATRVVQKYINTLDESLLYRIYDKDAPLYINVLLSAVDNLPPETATNVIQHIKDVANSKNPIHNKLRELLKQFF